MGWDVLVITLIEIPNYTGHQGIHENPKESSKIFREYPKEHII